jgi:chromosome partitioning protein
MTKVIAVLNQKGGCGKTTITINLAHSFQNLGYKTLLVDSDPQGSARDWNEVNSGQIIKMVGLDRDSLPNDILAVKQGYDIILIDGAPSIAKLSTAAIKTADLVLIPVQPSPWDIWATADLVDLVKARQEITDGKPMAAFIISRAIKNTKFAKEVSEALDQYGLPVLKAKTTQRMIYPTTASEGQTVYCGYPNDATQEIDDLRNEVIGIINGLNSKTHS